MIWNRYRYQLFIDDLPNSTIENGEPNFKEGIYVGQHQKDGSYLLYNHLAFNIKTHHV